MAAKKPVERKPKSEKVSAEFTEPFLTLERVSYPMFRGYAIYEYSKVADHVIKSYEDYKGDYPEYARQLKRWAKMPVPITAKPKVCFARTHGSCSIFEAWKLSYCLVQDLKKYTDMLKDFVCRNNDEWIATPHTFITTMMQAHASSVIDELGKLGWTIIEGGRGSYSDTPAVMAMLVVEPTHAARVRNMHGSMNCSLTENHGEIFDYVPNPELRAYIERKTSEFNTYWKFPEHKSTGHWGHCNPVHWTTAGLCDNE